MASTKELSEAGDSRVEKSTIGMAINALLKHKAAQSANEKLQLLPSDDFFYLGVTLKKIPSETRTNPFRISLPHPLLDQSSQICLIIDDRTETTAPSSEEIKKLVKAENIPVEKVLKLSKLKANYKPFEAKRKLCDSYDLFLVDKRVVHLLPKLIGQKFFKKKRLPLGVDLGGRKRLKSQVEKALGCTVLYLRTGTSCVLKVGKMSMEKEEIVENVLAAILGVVDLLPKKWDALRSLHLKLSDSVALPLYQVIPDFKLKIEGSKKDVSEQAKLSGGETNAKELSGGKGGKSGKKKKGRIHEVQYMDDGGVMESDYGQEDGIEQMINEDNDGLTVNSMDDDDSDDIDEAKEIKDTKNTARKKRNKGEAFKEGIQSESNGKKRLKKKMKAEKVEEIVKPEDDGKKSVRTTKGKKDNASIKLKEGISQSKDSKQKKRLKENQSS